MKKSLIALAVMAAAGAASAQSSVTLFGIVDATVNHTRTGGAGGTSVTRLTNSGYNSSRLGFRGTEDLGGGMSASFWLEAGINNDNGAGFPTNTNNQVSGQPAAPGLAGGQGLTFNRRSTVSLAGNWGEVRIGRDYSPTFWNLTIFDPFGTNGVGTTLTLIGAVGGLGVPTAAAAGSPLAFAPSPNGTTGTAVRASNSVGYFLPANLGGFYGQAMYYWGENVQNGATTEDDGRGYGLRVGYGAGPFNIAAAWQRTMFGTAAATATVPPLGDYTTWNIAGQWDFGFLKLMGQYVRDTRDGTTDLEGRGWLLGTLVPVGAGEIRASWSQYQIDTGVAGATEPKARQLALGYVHNLSKRTALYATVSRIRNTGGAAANFGTGTATFGTGTVNASATGYDLGIRHSF
jgi:predicted porin